MKNAESHAHSRGYADCRRSADDHFPNGARNLAIVRVSVRDFFAGKPALVEHEHAAVRPLNRLSYIHALEIPRNYVHLQVKLHCSEALNRKRNTQWGGRCVNPLVPMMVATVI